MTVPGCDNADTWHIRPILGRELIENFTNRHKKILEKYIAPSPEVAIEKIRTKYSTFPSISGRNSAEIVAIRKAISQYSSERTFGPAFMIVAPHTHWCKGLPILISVDGENYALSESVPKEETTYYPMSFAFTSWGLLAYEWADETVPLQLENMKALWRCAESVATKLRLAVSGFGLSINFRFKSPMDNMIVSTIEYQDCRSGWSGSIVTRADQVEGDFMHTELEQVAWHALMDNCDDLSEQEKVSYLEIRDLLDNVRESKTRMMLLNRILGSR